MPSRHAQAGHPAQGTTITEPIGQPPFVDAGRGTPSPAALELLSALKQLLDRGGPEPFEYPAVDRWLVEADRLVRRGLLDHSQLAEVWTSLGLEFFYDTMQGFSLLKPHGYAGDFEIIDRIYLGHVSRNARLARWDRYFHMQGAAHAVRNRKDVFIRIVGEGLQHAAGPMNVLNVGSGPCRDVRECLDHFLYADVAFDCVDQDERAIAYARRVLGAAGSAVTLRRANAVQFRPPGLYNLVWSAGLFDYLPDRVVVPLLSRMLGWVKPRGRLVTGQFSTANPTRPYMEVMSKWFVHHRTEEELLELARAAGAPMCRTSVFSESTGINLFLDVKSDSSIWR